MDECSCYISKPTLFKNSNVSQLIDHYSACAFDCDQEGLQMFQEAIEHKWKDTLTTFEVSLESKDLVVPLLSILEKCRYNLTNLQIKYMIEDYFIKESEEVQEWLESHKWFVDHLKIFKRIPVEMY